MQLSNRDLQILDTVIRSYILTGDPVGSKTLKEIHSLNMSPATIRSSMSRLCEAGLLCQPHTSAGRLPTPLGYRYFIQQLISRCVLDENARRLIDDVFTELNEDTEHLLDNACEILADITGCVALMTTPYDSSAGVKKITLVPVDKYTAVLMIVTSAGMIKSRICRFEKQIKPDFLAKIDNMLTSALVDVPLDNVTPASVQSMLASFGDDSLYAMPAVFTALQMIESLSHASIKLKGQSNLFLHREFSADRMKPLFDWLQNEPQISNMLSQAGGDVTVILGSETGEQALGNSGVIVAKYRLGDSNAGAIGILGPDRMNYESIIPSVIYFRESLSRYLTNRFSERF